MINVDMWNKTEEKAADTFTWTFYPNGYYTNGAEYRGNLLKNGECIGDFVTDSFQEMQDRFSFIYSK